MADPLHLVLDQNFPLLALGVRWPTILRLSRLADIAPALVRDHEDWEILRALNEPGNVDGFITNDGAMLQLPREMVVMNDSHLMLVITDGVGHDPIGATGLLMTHLQEIARRFTRRPQIFVLRPQALRPVSPGQQINTLAERRNVQANRLISAERALIRQSQQRQP